MKPQVTCLSIDCPERFSLCCNEGCTNGKKGEPRFVCKRCRKEFKSPKCNAIERISRKEIYNVCAGCGITANYLTCLKKYGKPPIKKAFDVSTFHRGKCEVCEEITSITEARDFFFPDFDLILEKIK